MHRSDLAGLAFGRLGNRGRGSDVLRKAGLSVDNLASPASGNNLNYSGSVLQQISAISSSLRSTDSTQLRQLTQSNASQSSAQSSVSSGFALGSLGIGPATSSLLGGSLGIPSLLSGLLSLFGGKSSPAPLVPFALPPSIQYAGALNSNSGTIGAIDYGQNAGVRTLGGAGQQNQGSQTVQIHVNAMDSQSFLDHSSDIASAVRQAIINSNSLKDVIADL